MSELMIELGDVPTYEGKKKYPLVVRDLEEFESCGTVMNVYSKGHHPVAQFLAEGLVEKFVATLNHFEGVKYGWWRWVPVGSGGDGWVAHNAVPRSRGAFPVTFVGERLWP